MKKRIIIGVFSLMILITIIVFAVGAIDMYNYEMDNDDIMVGFGAVMVLGVGGFFVFYELDLFYTVYYFFMRPKTLTKSILNILSNVTLFSVFFTDSIAHFLYKHISAAFGEEFILLFALLFTYIVLRIVCVIFSFERERYKL